MTKVLQNSQSKVYISNGKALLSPANSPVITSLTVSPSTSSQTITVSTGTDGYNPVNVNAVTSDIDSNITAENIKKDVQILGVTGSYEGSGGGGSKYGATADTVLGDVNARGVLQPPTEQSDLVFTGVVDVAAHVLYYRFNYSNVKSVSFPNLTTISGSFACSSMFYNCSALTSVSFPSLTTLSGSECCSSMFYNCSALTSATFSDLTTISAASCLKNIFASCKALTSVSFPSLTTLSGSQCCSSMFQNCSALTSVSFPSLTTLSGSQCCTSMFQNCSALTSVSFPSLTTITGFQACTYMFQNCTALTDVYFNSLTTSSFGSYKNQFSNMMQNTGTTTTHTLHFPSNMESTISGLQGYPLFGGKSGYVVLAYDLPATE